MRSCLCCTKRLVLEQSQVCEATWLPPLAHEVGCCATPSHVAQSVHSQALVGPHYRESVHLPWGSLGPSLTGNTDIALVFPAGIQLKKTPVSLSLWLYWELLWSDLEEEKMNPLHVTSVWGNRDLVVEWLIKSLMCFPGAFFSVEVLMSLWDNFWSVLSVYHSIRDHSFKNRDGLMSWN